MSVHNITAVVFDPGPQLPNVGILGLFDACTAVSSIHPPSAMQWFSDLHAGKDPNEVNIHFLARYAPLSPTDLFVAKTILPVLLVRCFRDSPGLVKFGSGQIKNLIVSIEPELQPFINCVLGQTQDDRNMLAAKLVLPDYMAEDFGLHPTSWTPKDPIKKLQDDLSSKGAMVVRGYFGDRFYAAPPVQLQQSIGEFSIWSWPIDSFEFTDCDPNYAIVVGAVRTAGSKDQCEEAVLLRPCDGTNRLYEVSYDEFIDDLVPLNYIPERCHGQFGSIYGWQHMQSKGVR